ncbi:hypothetical protein [Modestobacter sp. VKM Ac-2985]|uniref:hypothetical protein n=1 Tax=Modestobacter sp. VKM Ac-2985 TaxID=3004139 RepID=UPI0022ABB4EB|nr:hypothetical protein [Modestobacter sp. VKM Ac-2985]MCZ2837172.1 hypothetical protein [Modestobacter sp. VKM Ac-2985]
MARAAAHCPGCQNPVLRAVDVDTGEEYLVDVEPVDEGHVDIWMAGGYAAARRHGAPSKRQPAHELHACAAVTPPPLPDPYADKPPADQQHGGWR